MEQPEETVLGTGTSDGLDWELVYKASPEGPAHQPRVMLRVGNAGGGSSVSRSLNQPLGGVGVMRSGADFLRHWVRGEVQPSYDRVEVECLNGERVDGSIVDCRATLGFNFYVASTHSDPVKVIAARADGQTASLEVDF